MSRLLHVLPHPGGGGESVVRVLENSLSEHQHARLYLSTQREPLRSLPSLSTGIPRTLRAARRADLVHVVGDMSAVLMIPALQRRRSLFGTHGLHMLRRGPAPARSIIRAVVAAADRTVCSSESERVELASLLDSDLQPRLVAVPNGIALHPLPSPDERAAAREALELAPDAVVGLSMGQLEPRKEPLLAVEAAAAVARQGVPFVLLVAGDGPLIDQVRGEGVRALGFREDTELLLAAADIFILPSSREGLALALLEAMGHGLACVVSDVPGNREAVGDAGLVHPVGDVDALAAALARLASDPIERERLGAAARARVEERFTSTRFVSDMRRVIGEVLTA